jgi:hypothetical protein
MGDLYQELDPVVKDRFALCQTPEFVRAFILDRTLTPAIETFGADEVRLLDPACGSGHFLIDGLKRLVAATAEKHEDWSKEQVVAHALDRVVGIDLNDYACALARTRLIMTAAELAGVTKLTDAARFHPHVYWADGLEQVEREEQKPSQQFSLFEKADEKPRATLTRSDVRAALKKVFEKKFHAVVANPPFITEKDAARKGYHREKTGKNQRYVSAYREYSLGSPRRSSPGARTPPSCAHPPWSLGSTLVISIKSSRWMPRARLRLSFSGWDAPDDARRRARTARSSASRRSRCSSRWRFSDSRRPAG